MHVGYVHVFMHGAWFCCVHACKCACKPALSLFMCVCALICKNEAAPVGCCGVLLLLPPSLVFSPGRAWRTESYQAEKTVWSSGNLGILFGGGNCVVFIKDPAGRLHALKQPAETPK